MCGILGIFGSTNSKELLEQGLKVITYRGRDGRGYFSNDYGSVGHLLHSVVSFVEQPLVGKGVFVGNCEIYNWEYLNKKYSLSARNDAEVLFKLLEQRGIEILNELDGDYAFMHWIGTTIYLARDLVGVKPLWYSLEEGFSFSSEKKALEEIGRKTIVELNPRLILTYNLDDKTCTQTLRPYLSLEPTTDSYSTIKQTVASLLEQAIVKRFPNMPFGILFSGGLDSLLLAYYAKKHSKEFTCYVSGVDNVPEADDITHAKLVATWLNVPLKIISVPKHTIEPYLTTLVPLVEDTNVVKIGVGLPFFVALDAMHEDGIKVALSGQGSEEVFGGYERHKRATNINAECLAGLRKIYERDLYRDDVVSMYHSVELRVPFLDLDLVRYGLRIPREYKIKEEFTKVVLRDVALDLGIPKDFAYRKRKSAQYGSLFDKMLGKLAGKEKKSLYLSRFYPKPNVKLGVLCSSGKDSWYAAYLMKEQNYALSCLITIKSTNPDSYLFHTPNVNLVELQARATGIPLVVVDSLGVKEKEVEDLKNAISKAKTLYGIEGIVTGAILSTYQRDRVERTAEELGLKVFAPLWHKDQEKELNELLTYGFKVIISSVASDGLNASFLGRELDETLIRDLLKINQKTRINLAFEGGEAETLVLDCPLFTQRLEVLDAKKVMHGEFCGVYEIINARLVKK